MKNVQLPRIHVQEFFPLVSWLLNFYCIHDIKKSNSVIYLYHKKKIEIKFFRWFITTLAVLYLTTQNFLCSWTIVDDKIRKMQWPDFLWL